MLLSRLLLGVWFCLRVKASSLTYEPRMIRGVPVTRANLLNDRASPYCFSVSSISALAPSANFLATQVWPSARLASLAVKDHAAAHWKVCEFGCGPGLPSLTAASLGCSVLATDLDEFALNLVQAAAGEQGWHVNTRRFDLVAADSMNDQAFTTLIDATIGIDIDLVIFSDVFENDSVARGAATVTKYFLDRGSRVWTFAQSDRSQRDAYVIELTRILCHSKTATSYNALKVLTFQDAPYNPQEKLWLCNVDETKVVYG